METAFNPTSHNAMTRLKYCLGLAMYFSLGAFLASVVTHHAAPFIPDVLSGNMAAVGGGILAAIIAAFRSA